MARFIGRSNLIDGRIEHIDERGVVQLRTPLGLVQARHDKPLQVDQDVHVAIRPEAISFVAADRETGGSGGSTGSHCTIHPGIVSRSYFLGAAVEHIVDCAAGQSLGASRFMVFWRRILPLSWPGIQAGSILVFVLSLSAYVTPVMRGGAQMKTMPVLVVQNLIDHFQWPTGAALALILLGCCRSC